MKAAITEEKQLVIKEIPIPTVAKGSVLVKNHIIGINFADTHQTKGNFPSGPSNTIGFESAGEVVEIGEGVVDYKVGDRVFLLDLGTHAEYVLVTQPQGKIFKIPDHLSYEKVVASGIQAITAITLIEKAYPVQENDMVLVHAAAGGVGSVLIQLIREKGAHVIASVGSDEKVAIAKELGADFAINYKKEDFLKKTLEYTDGKGVHAALDSVGKATFLKSIAALRTSGTVVVFGSASGVCDPYPPLDLLAKNLTIRGSNLFNDIADPAEAQQWLSLLFDYITNDTIKSTIFKTYKFDDIGQSLSDIGSGNTFGRLLVSFD